MSQRSICNSFGFVRLILLLLLSALLLFCFPAVAADFSGSAEMENKGDKQYKAIRLLPEIYHHTKADLADLRIYDCDNQAVPYFIHRFSPYTTETNKTYQMKLINSFVKGEDFYLDYAFKNPLPNKDILATSLEVTTNNNGFAKQVELWGGYDNQHWEKIKNDYLYRVEGNQKLEIFFGAEAKKYTHYRFKIANNLEKLTFNAVVLNYNNSTLHKENFTEILTPSFTTEEKEQKTLVKIADLKNLKLDSITLETDSTFKRRVVFENRYDKILYNLNFQNTVYQDTAIPLNSFVAQTDPAVLVIENNDDQPIEIKRIIVKYIVDEVVFAGGKGGNFILKFGNKEITTPPSYDLVNFQEQIIKEGYDLLSMQDLQIEANQDEEREQNKRVQNNYKMLFNVVIVVVAVVLGIIILLKLKKVK